MKLSKEQQTILSLFIIGLLAVTLCFVFLIPKRDKTGINFVSFVGTYMSIFGIVVAYIQISSVRRISEITNNRVLETKDRITQLISITEIAKGAKLADEVQQYLKSKKYESAHLRLKDLKVIILRCEAIPDLEQVTKSKKFRGLKSSLFIDIDTLSNFNGRDGREINLAIMHSNIESISTTLIEFENKLKVIKL